MATFVGKPRNPASVDVPVGGAYSTGTNPYPGGTLEINDVTPFPGRSTGTSEHNLAQQASVARQYGGRRTENSVRKAA